VLCLASRIMRIESQIRKSLCSKLRLAYRCGWCFGGGRGETEETRFNMAECGDGKLAVALVIRFIFILFSRALG
jgi:hypothetical protein